MSPKLTFVREEVRNARGEILHRGGHIVVPVKHGVR